MKLPKLPWATWTMDQCWYFGIFGALMILWPGSVYLRNGPNLSSVIYWLTALVVLAYTVETYGMRRQMVRQNEIAVQPVVIALVEVRRLTASTFGPQVILRNIGRGPALFIKMPDVTLTDAIGEVQFVARFETADLLEAGQEAVVQASTTYITEVPDPNSRYLDFVASLDPKTAVETYRVVIRYENIGACTYESLVQMGKDGIRLLRQGKA